MKILLLLCILSFAGLSLAWEPQHPRGCIYINGKCSRDCEVGTHAYVPDAAGCGYMRPEATCENPNPEIDTDAMICDFSACYCDPPTVRNTVTKKCVPLNKCPK